MNFETWFRDITVNAASKPSDHAISAVLALAAEGATIPFIARYRKERTGNLDEVAVRDILEGKERWDRILERQTFIVGEIERQQKLTPELKQTISTTFDSARLEDLYLPYKQKRKTKAALAKEAGLEPLANWIWDCGHGTEQAQPGQTLEIWAFTFRNEGKGFNDAVAAIGGAQDILVERISETQELRQLVRSKMFENGYIRSSKAEKVKPNSKYENYFSYHELISSLLQPKNSHRYLAIRRGWIEEELVLNFGGVPEEKNSGDDFETDLLRKFEAFACTVHDSPGVEVLLKSARLALKAHVLPSIDSEAHKALKEVADQVAIDVFSENVRKLLLSSPFGAKAVLGLDPGIRTGCKLAVVDGAGKYIASTVIHLHSEDSRSSAAKLLPELVRTGEIRAVAVGNGTGGREAEVFARKALKDAGVEVPVVMVSEAGASVYSASDIAREEFPDLDLTVRGAISIARRLQDPLAELVKIDPKSIGVGQYQHDVSPTALKRGLDFVVDSCVNSVGVNLNTASEPLLAHVSGIGPALAKSIVEHRREKGLFHSRAQLTEVPRLSTKSFEQCAGFLRIPGGENPLDNTGVHPERYPALEALAQRKGFDTRALLGTGVDAIRKDSQLKDELGEFTFADVIRELEKPGRDPRDQFVPFQYRDDIAELSDLKPGMICPGIVSNVTNFGAFVDIGVHQDGLVHISQLSDRFIKDPRDAVSPGDRVQVRVVEVNLEKKQIALSMKSLNPGEVRGKAPAERTSDRNAEPSRQKRSPKKPPAPTPTPGFETRPSPIRPVSERKPISSPIRPATQHAVHQKDSGPKRGPRPQFTNNPFAALAGFKGNGKPDPKGR
ncbi:MAG: hypothetical protein A2X94_05415 [Bdellovibrionales bacterium GWB1_55_8]|nr:MAG: hypothetical protein A2X94_05415 [Bdellovibrionales bacterium GWB1_55_8]